jgi:hypothetical protein
VVRGVAGSGARRQGGAGRRRQGREVGRRGVDRAARGWSVGLAGTGLGRGAPGVGWSVGPWVQVMDPLIYHLRFAIQNIFKLS